MASRTKKVLDLLRRYESQNVTFLDPDGSWPIVWERAKGSYVWDADGRRYLDLTAAFGVAATGHANPRVVRAGQRQMSTLLHAMGDVHPTALKAQLARELSRITFERWTSRDLGSTAQSSAASARGQRSTAIRAKTLFCNSGFEAVEAALKTALLVTHKPGVVAFKGAYHGLGYGALNATHRQHFRGRFLPQLAEFGSFVDFPTGPGDVDRTIASVRSLLRDRSGAVLVEPVQTRGGIRVLPLVFLSKLRKTCDEEGAVLILDEIYTGFGRTGRWFACEHSGVVPDLICLGKALTGGFPLSACVGRGTLMDQAWPASTGEAIHTSTFLGHPVGCAMGLAQIQELRSNRLPDRAARLGEVLLQRLRELNAPPGLALEARGEGLLVGLELRSLDGRAATQVALNLVKGLLHQGFILLPEGEDSNVIAFTPPLTIRERDLLKAVDVLNSLLELSRAQTRIIQAQTTKPRYSAKAGLSRSDR